jgi:hypothetical protein
VPIMAASLNGSPLFDYWETSPISTAELFAVVEAAAKETATSVEQLISNAMTALLSRGVLLPDDDGALEKYCVSCVWLRQAFQGIHRTGKTTNGWDIDAEKQRETTRQDSVPLRLKLLIQFNLSTPPLGTIKINDLASLRQCG